MRALPPPLLGLAAGLLLCCLACCSSLAADDLAGLVRRGGYMLGGGAGQPSLAELNPDSPFVPASILKIATILAALDILGPNHRFETAFYLDEHNNLHVRGNGDPLLVSEEMIWIMTVLQARGVSEINDVVVDTSAFALEDVAPGKEESDNPYDADNGAMMVNFNTVKIRKAKDGKVKSAEAQTPTLPLMRGLAKGLPAGAHRINVGAGPNGVRGWQYSAELLAALRDRAGIGGKGRVAAGPVPEGARLVYVHHSRIALTEVARRCLEYSSNFMANQLFLACGVARFGEPATWDKGRRAVGEALTARLGAAAEGITMVEGSGLSRRNHLSPRTMIRLLEAFRPHAALLPMVRGERIKSGTLAGVSCYAGYLGPDQVPVAIMLNQKANNRDLLLDALKALLRSFGDTIPN